MKYLKTSLLKDIQVEHRKYKIWWVKFKKTQTERYTMFMGQKTQYYKNVNSSPH